MSPESLLKHFEQIAEAPDAVPRLRRFILDLAIRGKLVEQNPDDETASELFKRISEERKSLIKRGLIRNSQTQPLDVDTIPFEIPDSWMWTQLGQLGIINPRNSEDNNKEASFVPMPMIYSEYGKSNEHEIRNWGEIKSGFTHFTEGDVGLAKITPCFENGKSTVFRNITGGFGSGTTELHIIRPIIINPDYILIFLKSPYFIETGIPKMTGTAGQKRVPREYFAFSFFPLPPLAEQNRIVAKVNELMVLCDDMESAQTKRESRRDRLVAATLHGLNNGDTDQEQDTKFSFKDSARFYFNHLPRLTTRPEHIHQLRQTVLNLAVCGKLVPQNSNDEPASSLIQQIKTRKQNMIKHGTLRKQERIEKADKDELPFVLPIGWEWERAGNIFLNITDGFHNTPKPLKEGYKYLMARNIRPGKIDFENSLFVDEKNHKELYAKTRVKRGDILVVNIGAGCGNPAIVDVDYEFSFKNIAVLNLPIELNRHYIFAFLMYYRSVIFDELIKGGAQPFLGLSMLRQMLVPIPPLAEQHRIVARVDELMTLCDELEASLTNTTITNHLLLKATLHEALLLGK